MLGQGVQQRSEGRLGTQLCPPPPHPPHHAGVSCHPPALPTALSPSPAIKDTKLHSPPGLCVCWCHVDGVAAPQNVTWGGVGGLRVGGGGVPNQWHGVGTQCGHTVLLYCSGTPLCQRWRCSAAATITGTALRSGTARRHLRVPRGGSRGQSRGQSCVPH